MIKERFNGLGPGLWESQGRIMTISAHVDISLALIQLPLCTAMSVILSPEQSFTPKSAAQQFMAGLVHQVMY